MYIYAEKFRGRKKVPNLSALETTGLEGCLVNKTVTSKTLYDSHINGLPVYAVIIQIPTKGE